MKQVKRSETANGAMLRECEQLRRMICDLDRRVLLLNSDIVTEEEHSRVANRADPAYSLLARTLTIRRDNLKSTIAVLEQRLTTIQISPVEGLQTAA